jgi:hypothetical protein
VTRARPAAQIDRANPQPAVRLCHVGDDVRRSLTNDVSIVDSTLTVAASALSRSAGAPMVPALAWAGAFGALGAGVLLVG